MQSLYQAGLLEEAFKVSSEILEPSLKTKVLQLQSAIRYALEDYAGSQSILLQRQAGHESTLNDEGCLLYQANLYEDAISRYSSAIQTGGFNPLVLYNMALCHYRKKENSQALNIIGNSNGLVKFQINIDCLHSEHL